MEALKVLISAYSCRPDMGSEPGVGWNTMRELVKHHKVWVITRQDNRSYIEAKLAKQPIPGLTFIYCEPPKQMFWTRSGQQLHYYMWQIKAYLTARRLHREIGFAIVHHVTYVKYWSPSFLSLLPIPFVWGPVGGAESAPKSFWQDFSWRGRLYEASRDFARWLGECDPFVGMTARRSVLARATTEDTAKRLRHLGAKRVEVFSETGLSDAEMTDLGSYAVLEGLPIRFISMGRLLHWKGFHLGLQAFAAAKLPSAEYWICGDGPERDRLQALAEALGIAAQVKFWGRLPRHETLEKLGQSHILLHPSLHDSGGWVCVEAMAVGRPAVCLDLGGPASQITAETGIKVAAIDPDQSIRDLAAAMVRLASDTTLRQQMGQVGRQRVREGYSWEAKGQQLAQLYREILQTVSTES